MDTFIISPTIINNFSKATQEKFLSTKRLLTEYQKSGKPYRDFIQDYINEQQGVKITVKNFCDYYYDSLLYSNQNEIDIFKIHSFNEDIKIEQALLLKLQSDYPYIDKFPYNSIFFQPVDNEISDLVGARIIYGYNGIEIKRINLVFGVKCTIADSQGVHAEYSYITIDVDLSSKLLIIKVKSKTRVREPEYKPLELAQKYFKKVSNLFQIKINKLENIHKKTLCQINTNLYTQIYNKMVEQRPDKIDEFTATTAKSIINKLEIKEYNLKLADNNIFNVDDFLAKYIEHILISNILYESKNSGVLEDIDGYVTYIMFSDGTNISARLRGETYIEPIYYSESFMALHSSIENTKKINLLTVKWIDQSCQVRVLYDATSFDKLHLHFYKTYTRDDFYYVLEQYQNNESIIMEENNRVYRMEA